MRPLWGSLLYVQYINVFAFWRLPVYMYFWQAWQRTLVLLNISKPRLRVRLAVCWQERLKYYMYVYQSQYNVQLSNQLVVADKGMRASALLSNLCTVQVVLVGLGKQSTLGISTFQGFRLYTNICNYAFGTQSQPQTPNFSCVPCSLSKNRVWTRSLVKLGRNYMSVLVCSGTNQIAQVK